VRKAANRVRIIGQLIDASTGAHIWADRFDGAIEDIFDLQDQVTASVVGAVAPSTAAFLHDHSTPIEARKIEIDGKAYPYRDAQFVWAESATTSGLPATVTPIDRSETGLPIGVQIIGPYLEDRTPIMFAKLIEREFGGFRPPPGYAG
jgi:Asp-tRNA(Asn)/Glu-tRNA(Gln) amidotransferase A subunit family amidase